MQSSFTSLQLTDQYGTVLWDYHAEIAPAPAPAPAPACFLENAMLRLDNGALKAVQDLVAGVDILKGETEPLCRVLSTVTAGPQVSKLIVYLPRNCLGEGVPSADIRLTGDHLVRLPSGQVVNADYTVGRFTGARFVVEDNAVLYHILLSDGGWKFMDVSGLECESLCPHHPLAMRYHPNAELREKMLNQRRALGDSAENLRMRGSRDIGVVGF